MANGATQVRVRKNVKKLAGGQDELFWYAKAVADMQKRPATDPTSWRYQSGVHGYNRLSDPNGNLPEPLPPAPEQKRFWNQCQHQTWYFLPWHRGYLAYFEQIVAAAVVKAGGPPNWALPYWNYSAPDPSARLLPDAFVKPTLPDGSDNPLFVPGRNSNTNDFHIDDDTVSLECLTHSPFQRVRIRLAASMASVVRNEIHPSRRTERTSRGCPAQRHARRHRRNHGQSGYRRARSDLLAASLQYRPAVGSLDPPQSQIHQPQGCRLADRAHVRTA